MIEMDQTREWLREQLKRSGRGSRLRLAKALGFARPDPITRMLNTDPGKEARDIKAHELQKMREFFLKELGDNLTQVDDPEDAADVLALYVAVPPAMRAAAKAMLRSLAHATPEQPDEDPDHPKG